MATIHHLRPRRTYDDAVEQQGRTHAISEQTARPLPVDYAERLQIIREEEEADILWARRWDRRVTAFCIFALYLVIFIASFEAGRLF